VVLAVVLAEVSLAITIVAADMAVLATKIF